MSTQDCEIQIGFSPRQLTLLHKSTLFFSIDRSVCMWNGYVSSFASVTHNLLFSMGVQCACAYASICVCACDRDIPAAETWEGVTYETLDSDLSGDWGVLKCQNSNFLQTVTPSHTLWPSASLSHSHTHSFLSSRACFFLLSRSAINTLSFSPSSILKVPHGEIYCGLTPQYCIATQTSSSFLFLKPNTHSFSSHWASRH